MMGLLRQFWHFFKRFISAIVRLFCPIKKERVLCEAFGGLQYSCNPKYIAEFLLKYHPNEYEIVFSFYNPDAFKDIDSRIKKVKKNSLKELYYINTAKFIISNIRLNDYGWGWHKRVGQKYIMTWHGSMALKRIEFDAAEHLPTNYIKKAELDSHNIDLMLSDSAWCTNFTRNAFHYDGNILEQGLPRNDIFFQPNNTNTIINNVRQFYEIENDKKVLLYAPTFRVNKSLDNYISQWEFVLAALKKRFSKDFVIMIRLHPNMMKTVDASTLITHKDMIDVTQYNDMQELLCAADVLITDYSSTMFEIALMDKPCFLYVPDLKTYDRGFYFNLDSLPFPSSTNVNELSQQILFFDEIKYKANVRKMFDETFCIIQKPNACVALTEWMKEQNLH